MANPQPNDAHIRIAHSINEAIMMRDFSKRQRKILDLILRLSWGCGKKAATIPHQSDFEAVGLYKSDVKKELDLLKDSKVIGRDGTSYWFLKDFDQWQITRVRNYKSKKVSELLTLNLQEVSKTLTDNDAEVSKTLTKGFVKHLPKSKYNTNNATHELDSPKENKEILKKDIYTPYSPPLETGAGGGNIFKVYEENIGLITPMIAEEIALAEQEYSKEWIIEAIREASKQNVRKWKYAASILERWRVEGRDNGRRPRGKSPRRGRQVGPDKFLNEERQ